MPGTVTGSSPTDSSTRDHRQPSFRLMGVDAMIDVAVRSTAEIAGAGDDDPLLDDLDHRTVRRGPGTPTGRARAMELIRHETS